MKLENGKRNPPKVVATLRIDSDFKQALAEDALSLGMNPSSYLELLLTNAFKYKDENKTLKVKLANAEANLSSVATQQALEKNSLCKELEKTREEIKDLRSQLTVLKNEAATFKEPHLLQIFVQAKGETFTVERADGTKFQITCHSTIDLLTVMIYSFDYQKQ